MESITSVSVPLQARLSNKIFWCNETTLSATIGEECYALEITESTPKRQIDNLLIHMTFLKNIMYDKEPTDCPIPLSRLLKDSNRSYYQAQKFLMDTVCFPRIRNTDNHLLYKQTMIVPAGVFAGLAMFTHDQVLKFHHFPHTLDTTSSCQNMNMLLYIYIQDHPDEFNLSAVQLAHTMNITHYMLSPVINQDNQRIVYVALLNRVGSIFLCKATGSWTFEGKDITMVRTSGDQVPSSIQWLSGDSRRDLMFVIGYVNGQIDVVELTLNEEGGMDHKIGRHLDEDYRRVDNIAYDSMSDTLALSKHTTVFTCNSHAVMTGEHNFSTTKYDILDIAVCSDRIIVCTADNQVQVKDLTTNRVSILENLNSKITQSISTDVSPNGSLLAVLFRNRIKDIYSNFHHSQIIIYELKDFNTVLNKHWVNSDHIKLSTNSLPADDVILIHSCLTRLSVPEFIRKHTDSDEQLEQLNEHQLRLLLSITQYLIHTTANTKADASYHLKLKKQFIQLRVYLYERIVESQPSSFGFLQECFDSTELNKLSEQFSISSNHICEMCSSPFSLTENLNLKCRNGHTISMCMVTLSPIYEGEPHYLCHQCKTSVTDPTGEYSLVPCIFCTKLMNISI